MSYPVVQMLRRPITRFTTLLILTVLGIVSCRSTDQLSYLQLSGETMGTYYTIIAEMKPSDQFDVDELLTAFNSVFSTYDEKSVISELNRSANLEHKLDDASGQFQYVLEKAYQSFVETDGYFDITVMPLVRYWGFSAEKYQFSEVDSSVIDSLLKLTGMEQLGWTKEGDELTIVRSRPAIQLDVNALAKGYGVDILGEYLEDRGVSNYMVEIGGEVRCRGSNVRGEAWSIAIDKPIPGLEKREYQELVKLSGQAMASSGNYRNFYFLEDELIGHTINPKSGYPERNDLLAVSVITSECIYADALATGFMAAGYERSINMANDLKDVEALFLRMDGEGEIVTDMTTGFEEYLTD